jgi:hypothetical protein
VLGSRFSEFRSKRKLLKCFRAVVVLISFVGNTERLTLVSLENLCLEEQKHDVIGQVSGRYPGSPIGRPSLTSHKQSTKNIIIDTLDYRDDDDDDDEASEWATRKAAKQP